MGLCSVARCLSLDRHRCKRHGLICLDVAEQRFFLGECGTVRNTLGPYNDEKQTIDIKANQNAPYRCLYLYSFVIGT